MREPVWTRRAFLTVLGGAALPLGAVATAEPLTSTGATLSRVVREPRWLELFNTHTAETVQVAFRDAAGYVATALTKLNHLLRDHRSGDVHPIDPALFDLLGDLARLAGRDARYEVISGYRSPATNARLKAQGRGVATRSLHMEGRAIDVRLKGLPTARLRDLALELRRGGVGFYPRSDFLHVDTGRVRSWEG